MSQADRDRAADLLAKIQPFDEWKAANNPAQGELDVYLAMIRALEAEATAPDKPGEAANRKYLIPPSGTETVVEPIELTLKNEA